MVFAEFEKRLSFVISKLLQYEDGDIMLVSDLMGEVSGLGDVFPKDCMANTLVGAVLQDLKTLLNDSKYEMVQNKLTEGLDFLSKIGLEAIKADMDFSLISDEWLENRIGNRLREFLNAYKVLPIINVKEAIDENERDAELAVSSEAFRIFLTEATERIVQAQELVMELEDNPENKEAINTLFRVFHTIKGECGFLKIAGLGELAHNL